MLNALVRAVWGIRFWPWSKRPLFVWMYGAPLAWLLLPMSQRTEVMVMVAYIPVAVCLLAWWAEA